jgi:hypothetical protein
MVRTRAVSPYENTLALIHADLKQIRADIAQLQSIRGEVDEMKNKMERKSGIFPLFSRKKRQKQTINQEPKAKKSPKSVDNDSMASISNLMELPVVQSMLKSKPKKNGGKRKSSSEMNLSSVISLINDPTVQSLIMGNSNKKSKKKNGSNKLDTSQILDLIGNPTVQSFIQGMSK